MTKEEHKQILIEMLTDVVGARDYYLTTEDREVIVEALRQPTAYDRKEVLRELEELRNMERCDHSRQKVQKAIEIVKRGGRNE